MVLVTVHNEDINILEYILHDIHDIHTYMYIPYIRTYIHTYVYIHSYIYMYIHDMCSYSKRVDVQVVRDQHAIGHCHLYPCVLDSTTINN